jgi:thiol:disulfide interchange protein DsbD
LSGLAPPAHYNYFRPVPEADASIKARYPSYSKCANNLDCFHDYYEGVQYAQEVNKPVFVDFTGYGCVNCRKTEEHIWIDDRVWNGLKNDFVMVSLYVDDREPLDSILISKSRQEKLRNVGNLWADFQIVNFAQNTQPLYVIMTPEGEVLTKPRGYREGVKDYADFLDCGLETFERTAGLMQGE